MDEDTFPKTNARALYSAAPVIASTCKEFNADFVRCKMENAHPKDCVQQGEKVTACVLSIMRTLEASCAKEHDEHQDCLHGSKFDFHRCKVEARAVKSCFTGLQQQQDQAAAAASLQ